MHLPSRVTVIGTPPGGLTDASGTFGAGAGRAGTDDVADFGRDLLVRPTTITCAGRQAELRRR